MALYKDSAFCVDTWHRLEDGQELPADGHVILTAEQWLTHQTAQKKHQ